MTFVFDVNRTLACCCLQDIQDRSYMYMYCDFRQDIQDSSYMYMYQNLYNYMYFVSFNNNKSYITVFDTMTNAQLKGCTNFKLHLCKRFTFWVLIHQSLQAVTVFVMYFTLICLQFRLNYALSAATGMFIAGCFNDGFWSCSIAKWCKVTGLMVYVVNLCPNSDLCQQSIQCGQGCRHDLYVTVVT